MVTGTADARPLSPMKTPPPHRKRIGWRWSLGVASVLGLGAAGVWMWWLRVVSQLPAISPVSLSVSLRPWWRCSNWVSALVVFAVVFAIGAGLASLITVRSTDDNPGVEPDRNA